MNTANPAQNGTGGSGVSAPDGPTLAGMEPVFTAAEVAAYLKLDPSTTRRLFIDRAGVAKIGRPLARGGRRSYVTLRIPRSAVEAFLKEKAR